MAAPHVLVIVLVSVGLEAVVIVVAISVPMAVTVVFRIKTVFITPPGHKHLEVLWTVGMIMVLAEGSVIQHRVSGE